jgi:hypothetical protein
VFWRLGVLVLRRLGVLAFWCLGVEAFGHSALHCLVVQALCTTPELNLHLYVVLRISSHDGEAKQVR